ncbi:hypothetical protein KMZ29_25895 [Bradyrhizobium sediminis]|uniref:Uncharacterized protein n=1 Tax=Bradyrhizobium sediminis TaxID=2840469 RepID=A0A975NJF2_9BRAD|nr:hypothetical protein [Bradyrhizobium sediminis]QWG15950.1 hypothetical protein KMZ29_25895 [Bradyrhizobium sediminis]
MIGFPLLLIPLAIYNIIVFLMPGVSFADPVLKLTLISDVDWPVNLSDMLLALSVLMLMFEVIKGARPGAKYLTDHLLSLVVFGAAAAEFLLWPKFGTSTYFLLTLLALVDFLSGIALRARRGTQLASAPAVSRRGARNAETAAPEPHFEPQSAPAPSAPAPAAESVPLDRAEPKIVHPEVAAHTPPPAVTSPGLQPGDGSHPSPDAPR